MIYGIGVDSVSIARIAEKIEKESFFAKVFGREEQLFLLQKNKTKAASAAANFAAKEAFLKAIGTGLGGFALNEIQVIRKETGQPVYLFGEDANLFLKEKKIQVHLSLTHEWDIATAFCILEQK